MIEQALFNRLDSFPRILGTEPVKLRELADLLMEVQCAKEDGYLPALSYLDTARGLEPVVAKLPLALQDKWISVGSEFKEQNGGRFLPFDFFTRFIVYEAKKRNDPSFSFHTDGPSEKQEKKFRSARNPILVQKTNVASSSSGKDSPAKFLIDPIKTCLIHAKPHPLKRCKVFRAKTLEDRKTSLKEKGVCFKCLGSTTHLAKDCKTG